MTVDSRIVDEADDIYKLEKSVEIQEKYSKEQTYIMCYQDGIFKKYRRNNSLSGLLHIELITYVNISRALGF